MIRIYLITNLINGKQYVGKTKYSLAHRFRQHCNNDYYKTHIHNAIKKYGRENFTIAQICTCNDDCWKELEQFYIKKYHTHYSEGGYNTTWGGDDNPMDDIGVKRRHQQAMSTPERRKLDSEMIRKYNSSEIRKQHDKATSLRQKGIYNDNFRKWNDQNKKPIAMIDEDGNILQTFESCAAARRYVEQTDHITVPICYNATFKRYADKFNKNGKRAKFLGRCWRLL